MSESKNLLGLIAAIVALGITGIAILSIFILVSVFILVCTFILVSVVTGSTLAGLLSCLILVVLMAVSIFQFIEGK